MSDRKKSILLGAGVMLTSILVHFIALRESIFTNSSMFAGVLFGSQCLGFLVCQPLYSIVRMVRRKEIDRKELRNCILYALLLLALIAAAILLIIARNARLP